MHAQPATQSPSPITPTQKLIETIALKRADIIKGEKQMKLTKTLSFIFALFYFLFAHSGGASAEVVLNVQDGEEIRHLDPQQATGIGSAHITINMFAGLYEYHHKTSAPEKHLVSSFTKDSKSTVWTFKLRKDIFWVKNEKGKIKKIRPVTANDVVFSYRRMLSPELASEYAGMLHIIKNAEKYNKGEITDPTQLGVKALDDSTLELTLEGPVPSLISYLPHHSFTVVAPEPINQHQEKWIQKENIWTSSAYVLDDWKLKDRIILTKNPHYPGAKDIQVDKINFVFVGTYSSDAVRLFKAGKIDIDLMAPPTSEVAALNKAGVLKIAKQLGTYFIRININKEGLKDKRVRKALALTVPRTEIVKYIMKTGQVPAYSFVPNSFSGYQPASFVESISSKDRIKEAQKILAEAGYPNGKGLPQLTYLYNTGDNHQKIGVVVAKTWRKLLGVDVKPLNQEWKVYLNSQKAMEYDVSRSGWVADMEDPMNFLEMFLTDGGNNNTGFSNKKYDQLIALARVEGDLLKRNKMMEEAEAILMDEIPVIPVFTYTSVNLIQKYVDGFYCTKLDQHPLKFVKIDLKKRKELFGE